MLALFAGRVRHNVATDVTDDQKTYVIAGAAAAISLIAWLTLVVVPAWRSYWRVRDRLVATLLSVYVLAAFVLAGAGVGAAVLWYFSRPPLSPSNLRGVLARPQGGGAARPRRARGDVRRGRVRPRASRRSSAPPPARSTRRWC